MFVGLMAPNGNSMWPDPARHRGEPDTSTTGLSEMKTSIGKTGYWEDFPETKEKQGCRFKGHFFLFQEKLVHNY